MKQENNLNMIIWNLKNKIINIGAISVKFNRDPESMFSKLLQTSAICLFLLEKYFLKTSATQLNSVSHYGCFKVLEIVQKFRIYKILLLSGTLDFR